MKTRVSMLFVLWLSLSLPMLSVRISEKASAQSRMVFTQSQDDIINPRVTVPLYVRLQAEQKGNVTFWESVPQSFEDHVATIDSQVLALFVSSNSLNSRLSSDNVGNLWLASDYSLNVGDYVSTLSWVTSKTMSENLTSLGFVSFPANYPEDAESFLVAGRKIQAGDQVIEELARGFNQTQNNMTQTVRNVLDYVNRQGYDSLKTRLLFSGNLSTTDVVDVFKDALLVHDTNSSICLERSWYAAAILRAAGVPTRTVTDVRLKTWIQVWLPGMGWVDGETLCVEPPPYVGMLPKPVTSHVPWMIENSSDAAFPFTWLPRVPFKVVNLTFSNVDLFDVNQYKTVYSMPVEADLFRSDPTRFRFPVVVKPKIVYAAVTKEDSSLVFSVFSEDGNASRVIKLGESNSIGVAGMTFSFKPVPQGDFLVLQGFAVQSVLGFDFRLLVPVVAVPVVVAAVWVYRRRRRARK